MLRDRRIWFMAGYGFVSGLPLLLSGYIFKLWLTEAHISLTIIGLTTYVGLAYSLKFVWAPVLDNPPPRPFRRLGRRRGWLAIVQPALILATIGLALSNPAERPAVSIAAAALVAFCSASQDIAVDAWRIELFGPRDQGGALAAYVWGYRVALLVVTYGVIRVAGVVGWETGLLGVATLLMLGPLVTLFAPEPDLLSSGDRQALGFVARLRAAVIDPLLEFLVRPGAAAILLFVALFKLGEAFAGLMTGPFYRALGFDLATIANNAWFSLGGTLAGYAVGAWVVARIGVGRALIATGWAQTLAMGMYVVLARSPGLSTVLWATVTTEAFAQGMADAAFLTYLSGLCSHRFTATQYALLSSVPALAIHTVGPWSGAVAAATGWFWFYVLSLLAALPAMALMLLLLRRYPPTDAAA
jgi:PAT family beta-lactamase induction signal transducer AmpG